MKSIATTSLLLAIVLTFNISWAQQRNDLPKGFAPHEWDLLSDYNTARAGGQRGITSPPSFSVRTMAEWEEIQSLVITWTSYQDVLTEIVRHAKLECEVIIICSDSNQVKSHLNSNGINSINVSFIEDGYDSVWMRDYGGNTIYKDDVDSVMLVDWIYNRPRPDDDVIPEGVAALKNIPIYSTTSAPTDLVNTGGNWMVDGFGTAFASKLILEENEPGNPYNVTAKTEAEIDQIVGDFMGIDRYIKMETLPYDNIHHIDMHMKLLDEETLLIGEYPPGVADGPQIEANIQYVLSNYNSMFGTPYDVVRIEMPPENGNYPDEQPWWNAGAYRTYTNNVFVNGTVLVPIYEEEFDTTALRILRENLPGYKVVGIDCNQIIQASGAIHCITKAVGASNPLLISHQPLDDTYDTQNDYQVDAFMKHKSGIATATLYYTTDTTQGYQTAPMTFTGTDTWTGYIPAQPSGTEVFYYVHGEANSGKQQVRPIVAPDGYWKFRVLGSVGIVEDQQVEFQNIYPNPAGAITVIPIAMPISERGSLKLYDVLGKEVATIYEGNLPQGQTNYFIDASTLEAGAYMVVLTTEKQRITQELMVK